MNKEDLIKVMLEMDMTIAQQMQIALHDDLDTMIKADNVEATIKKWAEHVLTVRSAGPMHKLLVFRDCSFIDINLIGDIAIVQTGMIDPIPPSDTRH